MVLLSRFLLTLLLAAPVALSAPTAFAQAPRVVLFEDPALDASRLHYPLLISEGRGYRILCASQEAEEAVIRGLGFTTVPSAIVTAIDPDVVAAEPASNPLLCPTAADFGVKVFAHDGGAGLKHYLQFPTARGSTTYTDRIYVPACAGLVEALGLDLAQALNADPTPFFQGKIHSIACLSGEPLDVPPTTFAEWCMRSDRGSGETATVMAILDATPGGISALGNASACTAAGAFLGAIGSVNLNAKSVQSLAPLAVLPHLTSLSLAGNAITDIGPLTALTALTFLDLSGNEIGNLAALAPLTVLSRLELSDNKISDIRALSALAALSSLTLDGNAVTDLSPLQFLQSLSTLSLAGNALTGDQLEPLTSLGGLTALDLSDNRIETFEHLGSFPSTLEIDLTGNPIVETSGQSFLDLCILHRDAATPFGQTVRVMIEAHGGGSCATANAGLMATTTLDLSAKIVSDLRPLSRLTHLTALNLSGNAITDVTPLAGLVGLTSLQLTDNDITNITPVAPLTRLTSFDATGNPIRLDVFLAACLMRNHEGVLAPEQQAEVDALLAISARESCDSAQAALKLIQHADAKGRGLTTLAYFGVMGNLASLDVSDNALTEVSALASMPGLTRLWVRNNALTSVASLSGLRRLELLALDGNAVTNLIGVQNLTKLTRLYFSNTQVRSVLPLASLPLLEDAGMRNLPLGFDSFTEYCLVNRFDSIALGSERAFMAALDTRLQADLVDTTDCAAVEDWVRSVTVLNLNKKSIAGVDPIRFFTALTELHLFDNMIADALPIASLSNLTKLNLATNRMNLVPRFASQGLREIYLNDNALVEVSNLAGMPALSHVDLRNNRLVIAVPLLSLPALSIADLRSNLIASFDVIPMPLLPRVYLGDNPICAMPLPFFTPLVAMVQEACNRVPSFILNPDIFDFGRPLLSADVTRPSTSLCADLATCPVLHVRPNFSELIQR